MKTNNKQKLVMIDGRKRRRQIEHRSFSRADVFKSFKSLENLRLLDRVQDAAVERRSNRNGLDMEMDLYESTEWLVREKRQLRDTLENRLQEFVEDFVYRFEKTFSGYYERLENHMLKDGKVADFFKKVIAIGQGGTEAIGVPPAKAVILVGLNFIQSVISSAGAKANRDGLKIIVKQLYEFKNDSTKVREELVKSGIEIFQSFQVQFMAVTADKNWQRAMGKLSDDAVGRVINYFKKHPEKSLSAFEIIQGLVLGESKYYKHTLTNTPHLTEKGHTIQTKEDEKWNTAELFEKVGIVFINPFVNVNDKIFYEIAKQQKYGFRLPFKILSDEFQEEETINGKKYTKVEKPVKQYQYTLDLLKNKEKEILTSVRD